MDIRVEKLKLIDLLLHTNSPTVIKKIKAIFQTEETLDIWEQLTIKQQDEIDQAIAEIEKGETIQFDKFVAKYKE